MEIEPVQLIKEIPENRVISRFLRRATYPGSEYYRLSAKGAMPRIYKNMGKLLRAVTTITEDSVTITGGGLGRQFYPKGHYKFNFWLAFFDLAEKGKFMGFSK